MSIMNADLYDALKDAGAHEDKARAAAVSVASYENRFAKLEADMTVLKWMVGTNAAFTLALGALLLRVAAKVGAF
jgi:hypothetical protein